MLDIINDVIPKYIGTFNQFLETNLTLLDSWAYTNLDSVQDIDGLFGDDSIPIRALRNCIYNQSEESCLFVEIFSKKIGNENKKFWETIYQNIYDDLIPFCSYASENHVLHICNDFKKMDGGKCFTFNESSFDHTLGQTQGLNFVLNYDSPGTSTDLGKPITIMLQEPNQKPDIKNIMGMNYHAAPGHVIGLKIAATVIDTTEAFDAMNFNSRLCNEDIKNRKINCISEKITNRSVMHCGCQPGYLSNKINMCDTFGMICYEKAFANGTKDMNLKGSCYESCKNVKYSLNLLEKSPIDKNLNLDRYGEEFENYIIKQNRLYPYQAQFGYLDHRLQRMSIIHINFEESEVWNVKKDAKITVTDMIGNIGGTLGVFIGFSFLGLFDTLIEWIQYLQRKIESLKTKSQEKEQKTNF